MAQTTGPHPPASLRTRHMSLTDMHQSVSQVAMQRPPHKSLWTGESTHQYASPPFPLDPSLCGHTVAVLSRGSPSGMQLLSSPVPPPPVPRLALLPPQYHGHQGAPIHLLSHPAADMRMLQRSHSDYGPAMAAHPTDPRMLYNYRVQGDHRGQPIPWPTTEVILHPSSAPRQRSAKACKKCRRRKTKCSGGQPCSRCNARGLECEYDEKSAPRGPSKARMELRKKPSKIGSAVSRTSSPTDDADENPSASTGHYPEEASPTADVPGQQASADLQQPFFAHNVIPPALDDPVSLGVVDPAYYTHYVGEQLNSASLPEGLSSVDPAASPSSLIQGYTVPEDETVVLSPTLPDGPWHNFGHGYDFDDSDSSRPSSSHSTSSTSSWLSSSEASFASSAESAQTIWSATLPRYGRAVPPALSTSSSESSLKDALLDRPRLRTSSSESNMGGLASAADASLLTDVLSHATLSESGCVAGARPETSHLAPGAAAMSSGASAFGDTHGPIDELNLADVFSLGADHSPEFSTGAGDITIKGRPSLRHLAHYAAALGAGPAYPSAPPSSSFETVSDAYAFPGGPMHPPGLHAYH